MTTNSASETVWDSNLGRRSVLGISATTLACQILGLKLWGKFCSTFQGNLWRNCLELPSYILDSLFSSPHCFQSNTTSKITTSARSVSFQTNPLRWRTIANFPLRISFPHEHLSFSFREGPTESKNSKTSLSSRLQVHRHFNASINFSHVTLF